MSNRAPGSPGGTGHAHLHLHVLKQRRILEKVDSFAMLALQAPEPFRIRVQVEGPYLERFDDPAGHLGGTQLAGRGHGFQRDAEPLGELLVGQDERQREECARMIRPITAKILDEPLDVQSPRELPDVVHAHRQVGGDLPAHVRRGPPNIAATRRLVNRAEGPSSRSGAGIGP